MPSSPRDNPSSVPRLWLRRADQAGAALLLLVSIVGLAGYYVWAGGLRGKLIEIDAAQPAPVRFEIDINRAEATEIMLLPEVGETLAARIVEERAANGPFRDHEDLRRVRGIGPKTLDRIRPYLRPIAGPEVMVGP